MLAGERLQVTQVTHSAQQRGADGFNDEVVFQAQLLQVFIKVI